MIFDWNLFKNLVFNEAFLEIYLFLNNSLIQGRYCGPKIFRFFLGKKIFLKVGFLTGSTTSKPIPQVFFFKKFFVENNLQVTKNCQPPNAPAKHSTSLVRTYVLGKGQLVGVVCIGGMWTIDICVNSSQGTSAQSQGCICLHCPLV